MTQEGIEINKAPPQQTEHLSLNQFTETDRAASKFILQAWLIDRHRPDRTHELEQTMWANKYSRIFRKLFEPIKEVDSIGLKKNKEKFMSLVEEAFATREKGETSYARDLILTQIQEILDSELSKTKN